jgi:hypothetical protein
MAQLRGQVKGHLTYREGDGVEITIPTGPCEIEITDLDVTLTWVDGATHGSAAMPRSEYERYLADGTLIVA